MTGVVGIPCFYGVTLCLFVALRYNVFAVGAVGNVGCVRGSYGVQGVAADEVPEVDGSVFGG